MKVVAPQRGQIIRANMLWASEDDLGSIEGQKDRPAVIVAVRPIDLAALSYVYAVPITHSVQVGVSVEIPDRVKAAVGLDDAPQWVAVNEINEFPWPSTWLRAVPGSRPATSLYGNADADFIVQVLEGMMEARRLGLQRLVRR